MTKRFLAAMWVGIVATMAGCQLAHGAIDPIVLPLSSYQFWRDAIGGASNTATAFLSLGVPVNVKVVSKAAAGNGVTDDTTLVNAAISALNTGDVLYLQGKTYGVTNVTFSKSGVTVVGPGTLKFLATNGTGVVITGNDWHWNSLTVDGNNKAACGLFINNGCKRGELRNLLIQNIYGDNNAGSATVTGINVKRGVQGMLIADCTVTNVNHLTNGGTRVSRAIAINDFGFASTNDQTRNIVVSRCTFDTIGPNEEGDCVAVNTDVSYSVGLDVSDCNFRNFGMRAGKVEGGGTSWSHNWVENYSDNGPSGNGMSFSGFSFYGPTNKCNNNTIIGNFALGAEFGNYVSPFLTYYGQCKDNTVVFTTANAQTNGIGIDLTQRAYDIQVAGNVVLYGKYASRLNGDVRNCQFGLTLATNSWLSGIVVTSDGTNAPSGNYMGELRIESATAAYGIDIQAGANNSHGMVHGTVATARAHRASGVTGFSVAGVDSQSGKIVDGGAAALPSFIGAYVEKGADYTITTNDFRIVVTATHTMTLPAASTVPSGRGMQVYSKSGVTTTVTRTGGDTINQAASDATVAALGWAEFVSDGLSNWMKR